MDNLKNTMYLLKELDRARGVILDDEKIDEIIRLGIKEYEEMEKEQQEKKTSRAEERKQINKIAENSRII